MYCRNCGKEVDEKAVICIHCGCAIWENQQPNANPEINTPKTTMGVLFGLFLGLIGLVIGICLYPEGTVARKTFMKGWLTAFLIEIGVLVLLYVLIFASFCAGAFYPYY